MRSLNEDIKTGQVKNVYLLYGEEDYLKKQYKERLKAVILPPGDTMNYAHYEGKGINVKEVIDLAETLPFFAERRLIILEDTEVFKNAAPELADYIRQMPASTVMIFVESEVDKRSRMYKAVQSAGRAVELARQDEETLLRWILGNIKKEGKQIAGSDARYFLAKVGADMETIEKELEKLFCYTLDRDVITAADVDAVCTSQIANRIFDMVNAVADRRQKRALEYYYDLLALKEPAMRILFLLARQFKNLLEVKALSQKGFEKRQIAEKTGLHPFAAGRCQEQARRFAAGELREILEDAVSIEESIKTGTLADTLGVELFIMKYSADDRRK